MSNPLISGIKLPGRIFAIPSKGLLYSNNELFPTVTDGEVQVKALSALDELKLRSADLLFSGKAIDEIISDCVSDIKAPFQLFAKDIDAILCFLRVATYGQFFEVDVCHTCENSRSHTESIDLEKMIASCVPLTPKIVEKYTVKLDNDQVVKMKPLRYSSLISIMQMQKEPEKMTHVEFQELFLTNFVEIIDEVDRNF